MAEQPAMDSATDNSVEQKPVEQKIYKSEHDAVDDMKTLLGLQEKSSEPKATRTHEVESEVSNPEENDSTKNNEDLGEDAELINLLEEEEPSESNEELIDLDGEKLTLEEIKKERLRQKDYTQKTQKLAEERKEIDSLKTNLSKEYDVAKQQRDYYQQQLQVLTQHLQQADNQVDLDRLYQENPAEYVRFKAEQDKRREALQVAHQEQQRIQAEKQQEQEKTYNQYLEKERQVLSEKLPLYADKEKGQNLRKDLVNYAKEQGYSPEEISMLVDHRAVLMLYSAYRYDKLKKANLQSKKVSKKPKIISTTNKTVDAQPEGNRRFKSQMDKLKKTGNIQDAKSVFEEMIKHKAI
jgi:hypothetical protein